MANKAEEKEAERGELLRIISFAGEDKELPLLIHHGFKDEVLKLLLFTYDTHTWHWVKGHRSHCMFTSEDEVEQSKDGDATEEHLMVKIPTWGCFTIEGARTFFSWDDKQTSDFIERVFASVLALDPKKNYKRVKDERRCVWGFHATRDAMETYLPEGELRDRVDLWTLRERLHDEYRPLHRMLHEAFEHLVHRTPEINYFVDPGDRWGRRLYRERITERANLYAERLMELGMSEEQVREELIDAIIGNRSLAHEFQVGVLRAKILNTYKDPRNPNFWAYERRLRLYAAELVRDSMSCLFRPVTTAEHWRILLEVADYSTLKSKEVWDTWADGLAQLMAMGRFAAAGQLITLFDDRFGSRLHSERNLKKVPELGRLAARAFDVAIEAKRFGVAKTLKDQFGPNACLDSDLFMDRAKAEAKDETDQQAILEEMVSERKVQIQEIDKISEAMGCKTQLDFSLPFEY